MYPKIGFSTNVFDNPADIYSTVKSISADFAHIELELGDAAERTVYNASAEQYAKLVQQFRDLIHDRQIFISLHAPYIGVTGNLAALDEDRRQLSIERLKKTIKFAHDIGSSIVTCHPGLKMRQPNNILLPILYKSLKEVVAFANQYNIQIGVENMGAERANYIIMSVEEQIEMCKETGAKITLDLIHLASLEPSIETLLESIDQLTPYIINMHIADMTVPKHIHIPIGQGNLPLEKLLRRLESNGYKGNAIVEEFGGPFDKDMFYRHARAFRQLYESNQHESASI